MKTLTIERNTIAQGDKFVIETNAFNKTPAKGNLYWLTHKNHYYRAIGVIQDIEDTSVLIAVESVPFPPDHPAIIVGRAYSVAVKSEQPLLAELLNRIFLDWKNNTLTTNQLEPYAAIARDILEENKDPDIL